MILISIKKRSDFLKLSKSLIRWIGIVLSAGTSSVQDCPWLTSATIIAKQSVIILIGYSSTISAIVLPILRLEVAAGLGALIT